MVKIDGYATCFAKWFNIATIDAVCAGCKLLLRFGPKSICCGELQYGI